MFSEASYARAVQVFSSFAQEDSELFETLEKNLSVLKRQGLIKSWHRQDISAGSNWKSDIEEYLSRSDIILLLISPDFIASDDCYDFEMRRALEQYEAGKAAVIPIILRPALWYDLPIAKLYSLPTSPKGGVKPITLWRNKDEVFTRIVGALKKVIEELASRYTSLSSVENASARLADKPLLWNVPYSRNPYFTAREHLLTSLHGQFTTDRLEFPVSQALSGLGGIGKTQIALEYAYRYRGDYKAVFWIKADSRERLVTDFMSLADLLKLPERIGADQELVLAAVKRWFHRNGRWLLIFDGAEDTASINEFVPVVGEGEILITCRGQATGSAAATVEVDKMELDEGALFLLQRSKITKPHDSLQKASIANVAKAREITQLVAGHPLALDQAGAYIEETKADLSNYINLYNKRSARLLKRRGASATDHLPSVATTFLLSLQKVKNANPAAAELLRFCAFLYSLLIPEDLFSEGLLDLGPTLQPIVSDPYQLDEAIKELLRFSLIQRNSETRSLAMHRLVQIVLKDEMDEQEQRQWAERAVCAVNRVFPNVEFELWPSCQQYLPHALNCMDLVKRWEIEIPEAGRLLNEAGLYLYALGQYPAAKLLYEQALKIRERILEPKHPDIAQTLNNLGELARKQSRSIDAEQYYNQALEIRENVLGPEHADTAQTLNDLGELAQTQGKYALAETFYQRAEAIRKYSLGKEHPDTIRSIGDLAGIYDEQGDYVRAEIHYEEARMLSEKTLGSEHPDTALALGKLARFYRVQGKYTQAEVLFEQALTMSKQVFGPSHPEVATLLNNLAFLYLMLGKYAQAEPLLIRAIDIWTQVFDAEHPNTAASMNNLARIYSEQGDYGRAEPLFLQALAIRERELGQEHPSTGQTLANLGDLYLAQGRYAQAEALAYRALDIYREKLGPTHPETLAMQERYTALLRKMGQGE